MMKISSAIFAMNNDYAIVTMDDGQIYTVDVTLSPDEQYRKLLADWVAKGNTITPYTPPPKSIPTDIGKLYFIRALRELNLKTLFDTIMAGASTEIKEDYDITTRIVRSDPMTVAFETVAKQNGVTKKQIDDVFILANEMETGNV